MAILEKISNSELSKIKRLGYFLGSFDPLHAGHIEVVNIILDNYICDAVMIYCVNGKSSYKQRSDFFTRTKACEQAFSGRKNVIISYMNALQIQKKLTINTSGFARLKFENIKLSCIIGSDIAMSLELENEDKNLEKIRLLRQKDYMKGCIISNCSDSLSCAISLPAHDFIVSLRKNHMAHHIPAVICGRKVTSVIDMKQYRFISSSAIRSRKI